MFVNIDSMLANIRVRLASAEFVTLMLRDVREHLASHNTERTTKVLKKGKDLTCSFHSCPPRSARRRMSSLSGRKERVNSDPLSALLNEPPPSTENAT